MAIRLTDVQIEDALSKVGPGLGKYLSIQARFRDCDVRVDPRFRLAFNGFYRVRRGKDWQDAFYEILERAKTTPPTFAEVLAELHRATGRLEASFASKLLATVDPNMPVIDAVVLKNLELRLPSHGASNRESKEVGLHESMRQVYREHLTTAAGRELVAHFRARFLDADVSETKMLDFVLWQHNREPRRSRGRSALPGGPT